MPPRSLWLVAAALSVIAIVGVPLTWAGSTSPEESAAEAGNRSVVKAVVQAHQGEVLRCRRHSRADGGKVALRWSVRDGQATDVQVVEDSTGDPGLADCLRSLVARIAFPGVDGPASQVFIIPECPVPEGDWSGQRVGRFSFYTLPGDVLSRRDIDANIEFEQYVSDFFGVHDVFHIDYYKYPSIETKKEMTRTTSNGHACGTSIHAPFAVDKHEITHAVTSGLGRPSRVLQEGVAVFLTGRWQGDSLTAYGRNLIAQNRWVGIDELMDNANFDRLDKISPDPYGEAGLFAAWVHVAFGREKLVALYRDQGLETENEGQIRVMEASLGGSLAELDARVRTFVREQP